VDQTQEEISEQEAEINRLNAEIVHYKKAALKLAQTRLAQRTYRPNEELVRDHPQYGLTDEVKQLEVTLEALRDRMRQAQSVPLVFVFVDPSNFSCSTEVRFS